MIKVLIFNCLLSFVLGSEKELTHSRLYIFHKYVNYANPDCFGTLVSYKHVLTSAKCVLTPDSKKIHPSIEDFVVSKVLKFSDKFL